MSRWLRIGTLILAGCIMFPGCTGAMKKDLSAMQQQNADLEDQARRMRDDLAKKDRENAALKDQYLRAKAESDDLRNQLAGAQTPADVPEDWTAVPGGAMIAIEGNVLFAPGKNTLRPEAQKTLDRITSTLRGEYGQKEVLVFGHTDDVPIKKSGWDDNWQLSSERSLAVVRYLSGHGIEPSRLVACGAGEHRPVAPNSSESNRSKNRRVEIFALDPKVRPQH